MVLVSGVEPLRPEIKFVYDKNDEELDKIELEIIDTFQVIDTSTSQSNPMQGFMNRLENLLEANGIKKTEINNIYYPQFLATRYNDSVSTVMVVFWCSGCNSVIITSSFEEECQKCKSQKREEKINKIIE